MNASLATSSLPSCITNPSCALCSNPDIEDLNPCANCGEYICDSCPNMACACAGTMPSMRSLTVRLRGHAMELGDLRMQKSLMGAESLTKAQTARLKSLSKLVSTMQAEAVRLDDERSGISYVGDTRLSDTLSPELRARKTY
jgi:hypothetical protein